MQYHSLGNSGLRVSRLCLGTMNFGPQTTESAAHSIMDLALERGLNFFDTANVYGWKVGEGVTEQILGRWFALGGGRREKVVLATKVYGEMGSWPNQSKLSARHIRDACEASLRRLKTEYIDLYQMHHVDRATPWEEIWQAMDLLVQQGKVLYVGSSNFAGWHISAATERARARHGLGLISEQCKYNLLTREAEMEVIPACEYYGLGVLPWSPLASGALSGSGRKGNADQSRRTSDWSRSAVHGHEAQIARYLELCGSIGAEPADVAIAWLLTRPRVTAPIIGPRTSEQLEASIRALELKLTADTLTRLDEIFPPCKPSPEHFAW